MMCIGGEKLTKDRIKAGSVFSANFVTEKLLPMADYLGTKSGYDEDKMLFNADISKGAVLDVPILTEGPVNFEVEVTRSIPPFNDLQYILFLHWESSGRMGQAREIIFAKIVHPGRQLGKNSKKTLKI